MRRILLTYTFLFIVGQLAIHAQMDRNQSNQRFDKYGNQVDPSTQPANLDSADVDIKSLPPKLYMWHIDQSLGNRTIVTADTMHVQFQNSNLTEGMTGHYNHIGNLGAPRLSRIFFDRKESDATLFLEPLSSFRVRVDDFYFTNSNIPYTNLTYYKAGSKVDGEERFKSYFSVNVNKRLAFGFNFDYLYGRGYYYNQNTSYFNTSVFGSYIGSRYQSHFLFSNSYMKLNENGGIADDRYITDPLAMAEGKKQYESKNIPTVLQHTGNRNKDLSIFYTHRYNVGFSRDIAQAENDTTEVKQEYVPVTSFIHTVKVERARRQFQSEDKLQQFYPDIYIKPGEINTNDSTTYIGVKNTFGISLLEGFNKYAKAGLTAFISHKLSKYDLMNADSATVDKYSENDVYVGAELAKREGNLLHYNAWGEIGLAGKATGQFRAKAALDLNFYLGKDTVTFIARGLMSNTLPEFYMRHYHSKFLYWDNDNLDKELRTRLEGEINIERWMTNIKVGVENIKNYTYFNSLQKPTQAGGNIQIVAATLSQNFRLGILHLDNEVTWQKSSNLSALPLPDLSLYHNLYIETKLANKVLSMQLGADVRYFSKYYAPGYSPVLQQFALQSTDTQVEIGGYPIVNLYANMHLKRTRIFVMMYHVNQGMGSANSFLAPHYPINPRLLKIGISWNFYD